ncbi:toll-like receptor 13 [Saccostrea echinata]|uniref:toll-like receptor 13 n=1 Tax=Saccostrea echinata TaxID=191078 RepID=UPI002A81A1C2|nr:toll-like receptor 13 [Saccostrea echinata]
MRLRMFFMFLPIYLHLFKPVSPTVTSCGLGMCLCDDKTNSSLCKPPKKKQPLRFFPKLPDYISDVSFRYFTRHRLSTDDLENLTSLPLQALRLQHLNLEKMESGLFRNFKSLATIEIAHNKKLSPRVLRDSFKNMTSSLQILLLTSNNWKKIEPDLFRYVSHTSLRTLVLARNQLLNFTSAVIRGLNLTTLDLSFSSFKDLRIFCQNETNGFPNLKRLQLQSTKLRNIPNFTFDCLPDLQIFNVQNNKLDKFPTFCLDTQNVTNRLEELYLENTGIIGNIQEELFQCLKNLKKLYISRNKITNIPNFCNPDGESNVPGLEDFRLQFSFLSRLRNNSFKCLPALRILDLRNNIMRDIPNFCGVKHHSFTPNLANLYLSNTSIITLRGYRFQCLPRLKKLDLRFNYFTEMPLFCNESRQSLHPNLRELDLSNTKLKYLFKHSFACLQTLQILDLSNTEIYQLSDNIFSPLKSLKWFQIGYAKSLKRISKYAFNISSLLTMKFIYNDFDFEGNKKYSPTDMFKWCPNVTTLYLTGNHFPTGPLGNTLLKPLHKLVTLSLEENRMDTIHEDTFKSMKSLKRISLKQNKLIGWKDTVFENLTNLIRLNLELNRIAVFNKTSVPPYIMNNLEAFSLAFNPFDCGCDMIWFRDWLRNTNVTLLNFPQRYTCQTPGNMLRKSILSLTLTEEDCKEKKPWLIPLISMSVFAFVLVSSSIIIAVQLPSIKNLVYYYRLKRMGYVKLLNEQEFKYDAFVVYCEADESWVFQKLVPKLESEEIRLCIPDREFEVGADRCGQIEDAFKNSRKVLVVLSNEFAKNEWCLWQVNLVEERLRQKGETSVVFLLYKSINSNNMISSLHRTLKKRSVVTWYEGGARETVFWKVVVLALESPLGEPPVSVVNG